MGDEPGRLDLALVSRGLASTRSRARDLILRGLVSVDGTSATKPALQVRSTGNIVVTGGEQGLVSRGAVKLRAALAAFGFDPAGRTALDVGASTGGFTQVLLEHGAAKVYAADVGHGQLHPSLQSDLRVVSLEGTDARILTRELVPGPIGAIVADLSFISVRKALAPALALAEPGCWLVVLVKPQFEAGRAHVGKNGIVRDAPARQAAVTAVSEWLRDDQGWGVLPAELSPIAGGSGNVEFLLGATLPGATRG